MRRCGDPKELGVRVTIVCPEDSRPVVCIEEGKPLMVTCEPVEGGGG